MTCDFTSFSTVFQSYQDDGQLIIKGCVQWNPFTVEKSSPRAGLELGTARSVGQRLTHRTINSYWMHSDRRFPVLRILYNLAEYV